MEHLFDNGVTPKKFAAFVWPSIVMLIIISIYYTADSIFIARCLGSDALAAMNIAYPIMGIIWGVAIMLAAGSSAIVAIKMGEGKTREANEKFTLICIVSLVISVIIISITVLFMDELLGLLGATEALFADCKIYGIVLVIGSPAAFLGVLFEYYIRVDGKPRFTLVLYIIGGVVHIGLDYVFLVMLGWGIEGAAWANFIGLVAVLIAGLWYFIWAKDTKLKFIKPKNDWRYIGHSLLNGSSEMVSESSVSISIIVFNLIMIRLAGENGVAALTIVLEAFYLFLSLHLGYITGVAPLISYYYGAKKYDHVNTFIRYSRNFIVFTSLSLAVLCFFCAPLIAHIFVPQESEVYDLALVGMRYVSIAFIFVGLNIFASGFFTAYGNGQISALISLSRGLVVVIILAFIFSYLFGMHGIWLALVFTEVFTCVLSVALLKHYKGKYHYSLK